MITLSPDQQTNAAKILTLILFNDNSKYLVFKHDSNLPCIVETNHQNSIFKNKGIECIYSIFTVTDISKCINGGNITNESFEHRKSILTELYRPGDPGLYTIKLITPLYLLNTIE